MEGGYPKKEEKNKKEEYGPSGSHFIYSVS
jgi:hypothetical protein